MRTLSDPDGRIQELLRMFAPIHPGKGNKASQYPRHRSEHPPLRSH